MPKPDHLAPVRLVREDLGIGDMLAIAAQWRPDLQGEKSAAAAATADRKSTLWGGVSPQLQAGYQFGGVSSQAVLQAPPLLKTAPLDLPALFSTNLNLTDFPRTYLAMWLSLLLGISRWEPKTRAVAHQTIDDCRGVFTDACR